MLGTKNYLVNVWIGPDQTYLYNILNNKLTRDSVGYNSILYLINTISTSTAYLTQTSVTFNNTASGIVSVTSQYFSLLEYYHDLCGYLNTQLDIINDTNVNTIRTNFDNNYINTKTSYIGISSTFSLDTANYLLSNYNGNYSTELNTFRTNYVDASNILNGSKTFQNFINKRNSFYPMYTYAVYFNQTKTQK